MKITTNNLSPRFAQPLSSRAAAFACARVFLLAKTATVLRSLRCCFRSIQTLLHAKSSRAMAAAKTAAKGDPMLDALMTELERSKYSIENGSVGRLRTTSNIASTTSKISLLRRRFGATREDQQAHVRILRVVVRIGDYKQDSYFGQGMGGDALLPLDDDPIALRHQIWLATDEAYKNAGKRSRRNNRC